MDTERAGATLDGYWRQHFDTLEDYANAADVARNTLNAYLKGRYTDGRPVDPHSPRGKQTVFKLAQPLGRHGPSVLRAYGYEIEAEVWEKNGYEGLSESEREMIEEITREALTTLLERIRLGREAQSE